MRSSALPPRKTMSVGMLMIPNMPGVMGLASTSTLATLTRPSYSPASSSTMGAIILQGEHHDAQKSTSTGTSESSTSCLKLVSVTVRGWDIVLSWWGAGGDGRLHSGKGSLLGGQSVAVGAGLVDPPVLGADEGEGESVVVGAGFAASEALPGAGLEPSVAVGDAAAGVDRLSVL